MRELVIYLVMISICCGAARGAQGTVSTEAPSVIIHRDFVRDFAMERVMNALTASASDDERSGGVSLPGIFLHPEGNEDAVVRYPDVAMPPRDPQSRSFLVFCIGFRDDIPWNADEGKPNGVRFRVAIDNKAVFSMEHMGEGWQPRAIDVAPWAGQTVSLEFRTNAIEGNMCYDWAVFGQPMLVTLPDTASPSIPSDAVGMALAELTCEEASKVTLTLGATRQELQLGAGAHWIPLSFTRYGTPALDVHSGSALLSKTLAAPYDSTLDFGAPTLSTPLVTVGRPFSVIYEIKNVGLGTHTREEPVRLVCEGGESLADLGPGTAKTVPIARLRPGEKQIVRWDGLVAQKPACWDLSVKPQGELSLLVSPPEPETPADRPDSPHVAVSPNQPIAAVAGNAWSRLCFVAPEGNAAGMPGIYAIAETWNGKHWQRVGSMCPLAEVTLQEDEDYELDLERPSVESMDVSGGSLVITLGLGNPLGAAPWHARLTFTPAADAPKIHVTSELTSPDDFRLLAYKGPAFLAGDRSFGVKKDFAIFPGLEYLEGDEASSSERDLAAPLNDRHVPAVHKITTPLMAVQANDALAALLWDANQEWLPAERHPAARFNAPRFDSGFEYIHMSLFAPSVGKYVKENEYDAAHQPCPVKKGETLKLDAWIVLDHKARYGPDSIVNGPHKGGLVLQALKHWFDTYGLPAPKSQPREWTAERALCRDPYLHAVWSEDPYGWSHCVGWKPGLTVGYIVPLMLDLRAGVDETDRKEVQWRIDRVAGRALKTQGGSGLWSSGGCHIICGELPYYYGYLADSMKDFRRNALGLHAARVNGLWVWRPNDEKTAALGKPGDHTLGQASYPSFLMLRAARMTGDMSLIEQAQDSMRQMELYEVPRGAQVWECPLYQPDILAAAQAIRAYCEAYRITGNEHYLAQARYWAWTGLPFIYTWDLEGYPTMRYNVISVIGSSFYRHSWLGMPVVWCGLVYAYALQELAEHDTSFDWKRIAQGITNSAMWQQYTEGPSKGTYPDSWNMVKNKPNASDLNPENILVNEFRLRGASPEIRSARFQGEDKIVMFNSAADIVEAACNPQDGAIRFALRGASEFTAYSLLAAVPEPKEVMGAGARAAGSEALQSAPDGWLYDPELQGVVLKQRVTPDGVRCEVRW